MAQQYGYYFFVHGNIDAKLYAQTNTSGQNVPLLLRRRNYSEKMGLRGEKEFFDLSGVSYVVMKVSPGRVLPKWDQSKSSVTHDRVRLDHLLHMTHSMHVLASVDKRKSSLSKFFKTQSHS